MSRTYAQLAVSRACYEEVRRALNKADPFQLHARDTGGGVDMDGIELVPDPTTEQNEQPTDEQACRSCKGRGVYKRLTGLADGDYETVPCRCSGGR